MSISKTLQPRPPMPIGPFGMSALLRLGAGAVALSVLWASIAWAASL